LVRLGHEAPEDLEDKNLKLLPLLLSIHRKNFEDRRSLEQEISELLESYDLDEFVPAWLTDMLSAVDSQLRREGRFDSVGSEVSSVLLELKDDFGWRIDDQGEVISASFPRLGVEVEISREALSAEGVGCCSFCVKVVSATN